jgi:deoxyribodipyrimidine photo-lyase
MQHLAKGQTSAPFAEPSGFTGSVIQVPKARVDENTLTQYAETRNRPDWDATSYLGTHLRFGTVSVRQAVKEALAHSETFLNELIWREFFAHILFHFPEVAEQNFRKGFNLFPWRNQPDEIERWMTGNTGFAMVDAGMRQLVTTGWMHNRVRMIAASFLVKDLLVDWRIGEAFFAKHLLDFELASNNGNWQWAAGTGCDATPFFRIFNPYEQQRKFDPNMDYIRKWIPEFGTPRYPMPMIDHAEARNRALKVYKEMKKV